MKSSLKEINSRYYMPAKVVMLRTNHEASLKGNELWINIEDKLKLSKPNSICPGPQSFQHLYFTSDEEIKEGDWCYHPELSQEYSIVTKEGIKTGLHPAQGVFRWKSTTNPWYKKAKKIIATTDKSLGLPEPSKRFLEVYVDAYNEGKKIEEVLIEVEEGMDINPNDNASMSKMSWTYVNRIKVKPNNTITIKKVKDSWNRKEVIDLLNKLGYDLSGNGYILDSNLKVKPSWIERNL